MDKHKNNHIQLLMGQFTNKGHKKIAEEYKSVREEVDKAKPSTVCCDIQSIHYLSEYLKDKPFNKATREDMRKFALWLTKEKHLQESSQSLYLMRLKRFYKYVSKPNKYQNGKADQKEIRYPNCIRWIAYSRDTSGELPIENILTEEQIKKLLDACKDVRDQVLICSLLDGGIRKGELLSLKIKSVGFDKQLGYYFILPKKTNGQRTTGLKTGTRKIQLFIIPSSTLYIREYLNHHPYKNDPEAQFITREKNTHPSQDRYAPMGERTIDQMLQRIVNDSGLKLDISPHTLRHNSATMCAKAGFSEAMLRLRFGWSKSSPMPSKYTHLVDKDLDDKIKKIKGITEDDKPEVSVLQPIVCWNCQQENPCSNVFCSRCGSKLTRTKEDVATAVDIGVLLQKAEASDPKIKEMLEPIIREQLIKLLQEDKKKKA